MSPIPVHCLEQLEVDQCKGEASPGPAALEFAFSLSVMPSKTSDKTRLALRNFCHCILLKNMLAKRS